MKDRLTRAAFVGALAVHVGVIAVGGALAPYLGRSGVDDSMRSIDIGLETPEPPPAAVPRPNPAFSPSTLRPVSPFPVPPISPSPRLPVSPSPQPPAAGEPTRVAQSSPSAPREEPGGAVNLGTPSEHGDVEGLPTGQTPVGWVPGPDQGKGAGSGTGEGTGRPEPTPAPEPARPPAPAPAHPEPPAPKPAPPAPRRVSVRVCAATRLRPNPHCPECVTLEVPEDAVPEAVCAVHRAPPPPAPAPTRPTPEPAPAAPPPSREEPLTPARLVRSTKPDYPASALEGDNEGSVSLKVEVRADGTCGSVEITRSSGSRALDAAAVKAVKQWRWEPAKRGAEPVASATRCRVRFELEE